MKKFALLFLLFVWVLPAMAQAQLFTRDVDPQELIDDARETLRDMARHPDYEALQSDLESARGVLIFPRVVRGGFFVGGSGGLGVFMAWDDERGDYSPVAFYSLGSVSLGIQFGGEVAEVIIIARSRNAVDSMFADVFRLGGDASVAAGPVGAGRSATVTADFVSYARSQGAFLGMSLEGSRLRVRDDFNETYYGEELRPVQIIEARRVDNPGTHALREELASYRLPSAGEPEGAEPEEQKGEAQGQSLQEVQPIEPGSGGLTIDEMEAESI
ncbi:lipid-binding SYLF domain-containing protein [Thioalkalivibrio sp.]|uniref:lipid-binding SYLF domain-containing protein n=1 Tax=Thioalkalivibrio sp. TaxID=2093813 RepID=UPI003568F8DB